MAEYVSSGIFGQITGPFSPGENAIASIIPSGGSSVVVKFGVIVAEKDDMIFEKEFLIGHKSGENDAD